jgi:uncharacterized protein YbjT (DUF2867 family)
MILVTGATGNVGGHLVQQLCSAQEPVRALVRSPERADTLRGYDCEVAVADFTDTEALATALRRVTKVFLVTPNTPEMVQYESNVVAAVASNAPDAHVVKQATIGWDQHPREARVLAAHHEVVDRLRSAGLAHTVLAPNLFMQNLIGHAATIQKDGAIYHTLGDAAFSFVDATDVAAVAAHVLTSDAHHGESYTITGPDALTLDEIAKRLSASIGREVRYVRISDEDRRAALSRAGLSPWLIDALGEFYRVLSDGSGAVVTEEVPKATGRPARSIDDFLRTHRAAFR